MFGIKFNLKGYLNKSTSQRRFYVLSLIFSFLLIYFYIVAKYNLISKINSSWGGNSITNVSQPSIKSNPSLNPTSESVTTAMTKKIDNSGKYYVQTSQCQIPNVNPFTRPILETFRPMKYENCSQKLPLYTSTFNENLKKYELQFNKPLAIKYFPKIEKSDPEEFQCQYCRIIRKQRKDTYKLTKFRTLPEKFTVPRKVDAIIVKCKWNSTNEEVYSDAFAFVQYKKNKARKKPGVLMIGFDGLSRINLRRVMPKTYKYLKRTWFELQGYNKVCVHALADPSGDLFRHNFPLQTKKLKFCLPKSLDPLVYVADNTFPNLMPMLTGYNLTATLTKCRPTILGGMNSRECNIIWNNFKEFGYRTAYAEDASKISTFNFKKSGFKNQPTDYYSRPWMEAIRKNLHVQKKHGRAFCIGYKHAGEYVYDYAHQFAKAYEGKGIFGLFWTNTFSHDKYYEPSMMDGQMVKYFELFEKDGILDSTIVMFFSDHGSRWGKLVQLPEGFFEERLPTFFISLPKSFEHNHPDFVNALQVNRHRLTSPYDIHMTLNHILELYGPKLKLPNANGCKKCQSIFRIIPENRTCPDAGITEHWCACSQFQRIYTINSTIQQITKGYIKKINKYLYDINLAPICFQLSLNKILETHLKIEKHSSEYKPIYRIKFEVLPSKDIFVSTIMYDPVSNNSYSSVADISRTSVYKNKRCLRNVKDRVAEKLCVCKMSKQV